uniref:AIP3 domain-containing protein n=1 Tax=Strongyloides papillosus TaxID=174720 RepID=A0A0N5B2E0_STREA
MPTLFNFRVPIFSRGRKTPDPLSCERIYDTKLSSDNLSKGISRTVRFDEGVSKDPNQLPPSVTIHSNINPQITPHQPTNVAPSNYINPTLQNVNQSKVNPNQQPPWNYVNGYETDKNTSSKNNYNNIPDSHNQHYSNMGSLPRNYSSSSRNSQNMSTPHHRANKLLQQLRSDDDCDYSENDEKLDAIQQANKISHQNYGKSHIGSGIHSSGVIFVQYNDETKRALLPPKLNSIEQLKNIFLKAFPYLSSQYLNLSYVKIYIQDSTDKSQVFYELDDLRDVKDRCILKIREQISGYQSPPPIRFTDKVPGTFDYMSEGEGDDYNTVYGRNSNYARLGIQSNYRPASAIPGTDGRMYSAQVTRRDSGVGKNTGSKFDPYYDPYFSDTSSTGVPQSPCMVPRSANATPTIDREARFRMETMEKQLQGLSSLVHSALVTKNIDNFGQKDISDLRKQILEFNNSSTDNCDILSTTGSIDMRNLDSCNTSICSSVTGNDNLIGDIRKLRKQIISYTTDIKQLKKQAQDLKKCNNDGLRDMKDRINVLLNNYVSNIKNNDIKIIEIEKNANDDPETENLRKDHISRMAYLHTNLSTFERNVENLRKTVVDGNKKLKMIEVENLTNTLTTLGRTAAQLKTDFPTLYGKIENKIKNDMECVIKNETFIKEEQNHIDNCLKRCKTLANMMVTMKKLAMVQDPAISNYTNKVQQNYNNSALFNPSKPPVPKLNVPSNTNNISDNKNYEREQSVESDKGKDDDDITIMAEPLPQNSHQQGVVNKGIPPPVPPSPKNYYAPPLGGEEKPPVSKKFSSNTHVLDSILDELSSNEMEPEEKSNIKLHLNGKEAPKYSLKNEKAKSPYENISSSYNNLNEQQPPSYSSLSNKFPNLSNNLTVTPSYTTHRNDKYLPTNNSSDSPSSSSYSPSISNSSVTCNSSDSSSLFSHNYNPSEYSLREKQKQLDCQFEQLQKLVPMLK